MTTRKLRLVLAATMLALAAASAAGSASAGLIDGRYGYFVFDGWGQ
jgi:hypothetical protein